MGNVAKQPKLDITYHEQYVNNGIQVTCASMQGWREYMEDFNCVDQPADGVVLAGVFDGHGGPEVACFVSRNISQLIKNDIEFRNKNYASALTSCFRKLDQKIKSQEGDLQLMAIQKQFSSPTSIDKFDLRAEVGSTGNVLLLTVEKIYLANIGDTRAVLCRSGVAFPLSHDHKPQNPGEMERIKKAGGRIYRNRINGALNISRAFGDFNFKCNRKLKPNEQMVVSIPDVCEMERDPQEDQYIVIASDGVWDRYENDYQKFINQLNEIFVKAVDWKQALKIFLHQLVPSTISQAQKGYDNMTIVLVLLDVTRRSITLD